MLKKGKSKTGMRYIKIKITKYKGKYVQIFLRQKHRKYKKIKLKSPVLKKKKSFKLAYTRRQVKLWFRVRTYAKSGGKRYYSPYSKAKGVVLWRNVSLIFLPGMKIKPIGFRVKASRFFDVWIVTRAGEILKKSIAEGG